MAWQETCVLDERMRFIVAWQEGDETFAGLCRRFGISRKTGYKWTERYEDLGPGGLEDRSRMPLSNGRAVSWEIVEQVLSVRQRHPSWGPRKVKAWLEAHDGGIAWPAASTIGDLYDRAGLTRPRRRRRRTPSHLGPFAECQAPNDVWTVDFKGWFLTGDGIRVDPLTLSDAYSRYLLRCQAVARTDGAHVWPIFEAAFREFGLPQAVRSDNGAPFASTGAGGLSSLAVKLIKAGVTPERIDPGKPQQNGRHERLHLTLKQETAAPPARSLLEQMRRFERFRETYNNERPHEALGQVPPARLYGPSPRNFDGILRSPDYAAEATVRQVRSTGEIKWKGSLIFVSTALIGEPVGLFEIDDDTWLVKYGPVSLGTLKGKERLRRPGAGRPPRPRAPQSP